MNKIMIMMDLNWKSSRIFQVLKIFIV